MKNRETVRYILTKLIALLLIVALIVALIIYINAKMDNKDIKAEYKAYTADTQPTETQAMQQPEHYIPDDKYSEGMWDNTYTLYEVQLLAATVYAEAGSESDEMQQGVVSVILNRVASPDYPNTIEGVIYEKEPIQYECTINGALNRYKGIYVDNGDYKDSDWDSLERCLENTEKVLANGTTLPPDVVYQAEFKQGSYIYSKVGSTYFCGR